MHNVSQENYLKQILLLQSADQPDTAVSMGALAQSLAVTPASVTGMVKTLVKRGWVRYEPYVGVQLTGEGRQLALQVLRRHRLIELFLVRTLDMDWSLVHDEAEAIEHVISDRLLSRIDEFLGHPTVDPHGDPIPDSRGKLRTTRAQTLADCAPGARFKVLRIVDQDAGFLQYVDRVGLKPGSTFRLVEVDPDGGLLHLQIARQPPLTLATASAQRILVTPAPEKVSGTNSAP